MQNLFRDRKIKLNRLKIHQKKKFLPKKISDNIFEVCPNCKTRILNNVLKDNFFVCYNCQYHFRIGAKHRIKQLCDKGSFKEFDADMSIDVEFEEEAYKEKLILAKKKSGILDAVICGVGKINGVSTAISVMDSNFIMGSMGSVVGEKITRLIEYSTKNKLPLIIFTASGGARMQEGIVSLIQMAKTSAALKRHDMNNLLYISVLTDPTTGGVSASFAMLGDIIIAEPNAIIGFAGKRVIEKTINEKLPEEFQKSEFLLEKGFVDLIVHRKLLKEKLYKLLILHGVN